MTLQTFRPLPPTAYEPLVVPLDPVAGWRTADAGRRSAAVLALPLALLVSLAATTGALPDGVLYGWIGAGPAAFYSLARVLRPERRSAERTPRHLLAAAATALAVPTIACLLAPSGDTDEVVIGYGTPAFVLGVLTAAWGLGALAVRAWPRR